MSNVVVVAIPHPDDYVWKISSEKIPHMTILFLGESGNVKNLSKIEEFVEHAAETTLHPFYMDVTDRGVLGEDKADVLFFDEAWDLELLRNFRAQLLQNDSVKMAYDSVEQFPDWKPHLTLGYPETPAKPDDREYPGISGVRFNRIAVWHGNYEGPEFKLKHNLAYGLAEVSMSDVKSVGKDAVTEFLAHYGVKGMRWGVRRNNVPSEVSVTQKGTKLKAKGGGGNAPSADAVKAAKASQKAKSSGLHSLSNQELQEMVTRLNLEQQAIRLQSGGKSSAQKSDAKAFVKEVLKDVGKQQVKRTANDAASRQLDRLIRK